MTSDAESFGKRIARLRQQRGWTQERLAERLADLTEEQRVHVTAALLPPHDESLLVNNFIIPVELFLLKSVYCFIFYIS